MLKGNFDAADLNKDGKITRDEWDSQGNYMKSGKNVACLISFGVYRETPSVLETTHPPRFFHAALQTARAG